MSDVPSDEGDMRVLRKHRLLVPRRLKTGKIVSRCRGFTAYGRIDDLNDEYRLAAPEPISTTLTVDEIALKAQLHEQAAQNVTATLSRMQERTHQASQANPELAPFLTAYFQAAGTSLLQNTLAMLDEPPIVSPPQHSRGKRSPRRRIPFAHLSHLIPVRIRKEQPDGAA